MNLSDFGSYRAKIFTATRPPFRPGQSVLDIGCGDGADAQLLAEAYGVKVTAADVSAPAVWRGGEIAFHLADVTALPFADGQFDGVFLHDVLHHVDEPAQRIERHRQALAEAWRVVAPGGALVIVEGNRYNPLFYPHMVRLLGHDHWRQGYFCRLVREQFSGQQIDWRFFEAHHYPWGGRWWLAYEWLMDHLCPRWWRAYNVAIIHRQV